MTWICDRIRDGGVPAALVIGTVILDDGTEVKGFVAESRALNGAEDITALDGWRAQTNTTM